jgi:beta-mannosidase
VQLEVLADGVRSDAHSFSFGIRTFELRDWIGHLNGVRFLIKGNNYPPGDTRIATMTRTAFDRDLQLAQACHMNMLRVHAHVEHPAFYEAADAAGILLWQDFPLQWLYRREVLPEARRQVVEMVELLANHASVAIWCMHNEPIYAADTKDERFLTRARTYTSVFLWSWNRDVMDTQLKELTLKTDSTRPAVRSSGEYAVPLWRPGTDGHFYHGWYMVYGYPHTWATIAQRLPSNIRFITEFGAQSFPNVESCVKFMGAEITAIDWDELRERHHFQPNIMDHWMDWRGAGSLADLVQMTQDYQSAINRFYIDRLRYYKYRPTGGIIPFMFHDSNPAVQWSIIDYWRVPKRSYDAMRLAFAPQYVFTLLARDRYPLGAPLELPIYVVNDAHRTVPIVLRARLTAPDGREMATIERALDLPADCMALEIERLRLTPTVNGAYRLDLEWSERGGDTLKQRYEVEVPL